MIEFNFPTTTRKVFQLFITQFELQPIINSWTELNWMVEKFWFLYETNFIFEAIGAYW